MQSVTFFNTTPSRQISFTANPIKFNLGSVKESLCNDYFEKQISPFDNPLFYRYLSKNSKQTDSILNKIYKRKLPAYDKVLADNNIDKKHRILLVDPEIAAHIDEFGQYVSSSNIDTKKLSPFELRKQFSDYLGTETVYRGLYSDDCNELLETLKKDGIYPKIAENKSSISDSLGYYLSVAGESALNVFSRLNDVIKGKKNTEFMSVSSIYDVAASVAKNGSNSASTPVVVAKTEVPRLSVIKQKGDFSTRKSVDKDVLIIGDKKYDCDTQKSEIESFIPFHISTKNTEFTIDTTTPDYRWGY